MKSKTKLLSGAIALVLSGKVFAAESATAIINLQSFSGTGINETFTYNVKVTDTGTTNLETFWYAWLPPDNFYDFLKSTPTSEVNPTGWTANLEGLKNGTDNNSIQWVTSTNPLTPGNSLTFQYTTHDNPATVTGPAAFGFPTGYSYVYIGQPETDSGALVNVAVGNVALPEPASINGLAAMIGALAVRRPRRRRGVSSACLPEKHGVCVTARIA
jgi:hypothetical protein